MKNLAIIPARSGSKGLKDKNIMKLNGKPLLEYSIQAAKETGLFTEIMVSTDSGIYAEIAKKCGALVPFLRSESKATDTASSWDVVREVLDEYKKCGKEFDTICLLQPTSPLRNADDIISGYNIYGEKNAIAVVGMCEMEHSPLWSNTINDDEELDGFLTKELLQPRQQIEKYFRVNGALYIVNVKEFISNPYIYRKGSYAYIMDQKRSIDIDTEIDFLIAELLMKNTWVD